MYKLILFIVLVIISISFNAFSQAVVVRDPTWQAEEHAKFMEHRAQWAKELAQLSNQVDIQRRNLELLQDATKKLREVNRRIANYRHLEESISLTYACYDRLTAFIKQLERDDLFKPEEIRAISTLLLSALSMTSNSINALTIVVTDNFAEMNDAERLANLNAALLQLRQDVGVFHSFIWEIEVLNNHRMQLRTFKFIKESLK